MENLPENIHSHKFTIIAKMKLWVIKILASHFVIFESLIALYILYVEFACRLIGKSKQKTLTSLQGFFKSYFN